MSVLPAILVKEGGEESEVFDGHKKIGRNLVAGLQVHRDYTDTLRNYLRLNLQKKKTLGTIKHAQTSEF